MKTTDLMIGDWVHIYKENMCYDADYRITGIEEKIHLVWVGILLNRRCSADFPHSRNTGEKRI